jgi:hypothetical protein
MTRKTKGNDSVRPVEHVENERYPRSRKYIDIQQVKCSGDKPVCANCLRLNSPCVYAPSIKGKAPRSGYNEMLQKVLIMYYYPNN